MTAVRQETKTFGEKDIVNQKSGEEWGGKSGESHA